VKHFDPSASARRFEAGSPALLHVFAVPAALRLLGEFGFDRIAAHVAELAQALLKGAKDLRIKAKTPSDTRGRSARTIWTWQYVFNATDRKQVNASLSSSVKLRGQVLGQVGCADPAPSSPTTTNRLRRT